MSERTLHHDTHAGHGHGEHGADAEYLATPGSSYEHTDADVGSIVRFGVWLAVIAILTHALLAGGFAGLIAWARETGQPRYPLAAEQQPPRPPEPVLQRDPAADMAGFRATDEGTLEGYGWVDRGAGRVHIPIDEAIRLTLERGLPSRPQEGAATAPGMMASDASAGRLLERRRQ